jgi:hypothetical protein
VHRLMCRARLTDMLSQIYLKSPSFYIDRRFGEPVSWLSISAAAGDVVLGCACVCACVRVFT